MNIKVLDQNTIDRIAAGEVVERPASAAKELIENAFDSGATAITIEISGGGIDMIRVTDNGSGIDPSDVRTAFLRHATSKLRNIDDLYSIRSLGFRGEALSSIGAVSRMELVTRTKDSLSAIRYVYEGGTEKVYEEIGAPAGTTVIMRNLFYNTPARAKFLKSPRTEGSAIASLVEELALSHPDVSIDFINNNDSKLFTSGSGDLKETVFSIYGRELTEMLGDVSYKDDTLSMSGFLGRPEAARGSRNYEMIFVNGRFVKDRIISAACEEACKGSLMQHKFPFVILNIDIDTERVDVNVHPSKMNLKFSDEQAVYESVFKGIKAAMEASRRIPYIELGTPRTKASSVPSVPEKLTGSENAVVKDSIPKTATTAVTYGLQKTVSSTTEDSQLNPVFSTGEENLRKNASPGRTEHNMAGLSAEPFSSGRKELESSVREYHQQELKELIPEAAKEPEAPYFEGLKKNIHIIGQLFDTYILAEENDDFYIIDQHAAHEKVMYERFMRDLKNRELYTQQLMPAKIVHLSAAQQDVFNSRRAVFESIGFEIEEFGGSEFRISAVPYHFYGADPDSLFTGILDNEPRSGKEKEDAVRDRIIMKSCKAAVKANMRLSGAEIKALVDELFSLDDPYRCPHGRPAVVKMSRYEMDKKFKRII